MDNLDDIVLDSDVFQEKRIKKGPLSYVSNKVSDAYSKAKAFTLTELLVVISVSALLMAILFPALQSVKERAKRAVCQSNLRQIGIAQEAYANNNENYLPWSGFRDGQAYQDFALKYLGDGKVFLCPSDRENEINDVNNWKINKDDSVFASYLAQGYFLYLENRLKNTENTPSGIATWWDIKGGYNKLSKGMNHGVGGGNVLYLDCHSEWLKKGKWGRKYNPTLME